MLTEFGGIAFSRDTAHTWGYSRGESEEDFAKRYLQLLKIVRALPVLAGFCYTQLTDTFQEKNGLLTMRRDVRQRSEFARVTRNDISDGAWSLVA